MKKCFGIKFIIDYVVYWFRYYLVIQYYVNDNIREYKNLESIGICRCIPWISNPIYSSVDR